MKSCLLEIDARTHSLVDYAGQQAESYIQSADLNERKSRGQFFTSKQVASFMAGLFEVQNTVVNILDPGAGLGMLSAAVCDHLLKSKRVHDITLDAYETDPKLMEHLDKVLHECELALTECGHSFHYRIISDDFILNNPNYFYNKTLFPGNGKPVFYDFIISNPPYFKLTKNSPYVQLMGNLSSGQPNIYSAFMTLSLEMLKPDGQMVFITPRSFCSGLYFKKFRKWLLDRGQIQNLHIFDSRSDVFNAEEVLQENIILRMTPKGTVVVNNKAAVSKSRDSLFHDFYEMKIDYEDVFHRKNGDIFIKVPTSKTDINVQHIVNQWKYTLRDFGLKVSTGPVVSFRATDFLTNQVSGTKKIVPLLWMHNIKDWKIEWPVQKNKKEMAILVTDESKPLLVPSSNYVLIKRFSSKEQKKRVQAGVLLKADLDYSQMGLENHLNYIYKQDGMLTKEEVYGIAGILNTSIVDIFFRMLNGSTQVNAVDIDNIPLPSIDDVRKIGGAIIKNKPDIGFELDKLVVDALGIKNEILNELKRGY
jgi:adenine-specific DNA-methyltransferase